MQRVQGMLLFLVLAVNSAQFQIYIVTRSYSSRPFLCALVLCSNSTCLEWRNGSCMIHLPLVRTYSCSCLTVLTQQPTVTINPCCYVWFVCYNVSDVLLAQAHHTTVKHLPSRMVFCPQGRPLNVQQSSQPTIYGGFPLTKYPQIKPLLKPQSYVIVSFGFPANTLTFLILKMWTAWPSQVWEPVGCESL